MFADKRGARWRSAFLGAVVAAVVVLGVPAVADIGDPVLQGKFNSVNKKTTLAGSAAGDSMLRVVNRAADGSGINVKVAPGRPPFVVNTAKKVRKLNADRVDGKSASHFVRSDSAFSCAGTAWEAIDSNTPYNTSASLKYRTAATGNSIFRCSAELPDGVWVTAVTWAVRDASAGETASCAMWRTDMTNAVGDEESMAFASTSGSPGDVALVTTNINNSEVDTERYSYFVQCALGTTSDVGVYGAIVEYASKQPAPAPAPGPGADGDVSSDG